MEPRNTLGYQLQTLSHRVLDADGQLSLTIVLDRFQTLGQLDGNLRSTQRRDPLDPRKLGDRHDARHQWHLDSRRMVAVAEPQEVVVDVEQLSESRVGSGVDLAFQVLQIARRVWRLGMHFRIRRHADPHLVALAADQLDQLVAMLQPARHSSKTVRAPRRIASQCHDVVDARSTDRTNPLDQLGTSGTDTRQVSRRHRGVPRTNLATQVQRSVSSRTAGAVGAGYERWRVLRQTIQVLEKNSVTVLGLRWENLDRDLRPRSRRLATVNLSQRQYHSDNTPHNTAERPRPSTCRDKPTRCTPILPIRCFASRRQCLQSRWSDPMN